MTVQPTARPTPDPVTLNKEQIAELRSALERVRANAKAWHGPEGLETGHARALAVIAQWCAEALARLDVLQSSALTDSLPVESGDVA